MMILVQELAEQNKIFTKHQSSNIWANIDFQTLDEKKMNKVKKASKRLKFNEDMDLISKALDPAVNVCRSSASPKT